MSIKLFNNILCTLIVVCSFGLFSHAASGVKYQEKQRDRTELIIIASDIENKADFYRTTHSGTTVVELSSFNDSIDELQAILERHNQLDALHIISHGKNGEVSLGQTPLTESAFLNNPSLIDSFKSAIKPSGDILIYGCDVAKSVTGQRFVDFIAEKTERHVAASKDITGSELKKANWQLEYQVGDIDSTLPVLPHVLDNYQFTLPTVTYAGLGFSDSGGSGFKSLTDANLVVSNDFTPDSGDMFYNNTVATSKTLVIKTDGVDAGTLDIDALILYAFNVNGITIDSTSTIAFKDGGGSTLQTMTLNSNKFLAQNADTDIFSLFDNNTTSPVLGVAQIDFNFVINGCCVNGNNFSSLTFKNITYSNPTPPSSGPTITGVTYDSSNGNLVVTGSDFDANPGGANDITVNKLTITGEGGGGSAYTLTSGINIERDSANQFTVPISGIDKLRVDALLNKNSTTADDGTTYNLAAADDFVANVTAGDTAIATNAIIVSNYANPSITSSTYDATTGALVVTGTGFSSINGSNNDVVTTTLTLTGEGGSTYTLTSSNVDVTSATQFTLTLNATDRMNVNGLLNKNGANAEGGQAYNLAAADNWMAGGPANVNIADSAATVNVSNVTSPAITSATYNHGTGVLTVTGTNFVALSGGANDVDVSTLTLLGEGGNAHALTSTDVEITSATSFTVTLNAADKLVINGLLNKNGTQADDGATNYNLNAADNYLPAVAASTNIADATNAVTVSNVVAPTISSATYNAGTGTLVVSGTGFARKFGATNDIDVSLLALTGENGNSYTLTTSDVELTSETQFTITLNANDRLEINGLLNNNGTASGNGTTYNLAGTEDWQAGAATNAIIADLTLNGITVSNVQIPTVSSATYDFSTGQLVVTGTNFVKKPGVTNDVDVTKIELKGLGSGTRTLTTTNVEITSATSFSITLNSGDKTAVNALLDTNGTQASDTVVYNLNAAEDWLTGAAAAASIADTVGNGITVSNVAVPAITSATYDSSTGNLVVTGTDFEAKSGALNDITVSNLTITGQGGGTYTLTSSDVEITSASQFTVSLNSTDRLSIDALLNKNGLSSDGGTTYNLAAADDFVANVTAGNTADLTSNAITVSNFSNPTITSATYDASTGALVVTGTGFSSVVGSNNDVVATTFTLTGDSGATYTLTSSNVDVTSQTEFTLTLNATDLVNVNGLLDKDGLSASSGQAYNLAAADNWLAGGPSTVDIADNAATVTVSNVIAPTLTSATYDASTGVLVVTGTNFVAFPGAANDVDVSQLSIRGEDGAYVLTSPDVEVSNTTSFTITLSAADKIIANGIFNKDGVQADDLNVYNLAAGEDYLLAVAPASNIQDLTNAVTVSNVSIPTITSATYNAGTGSFVVTGTGFARRLGLTNDIDVSWLTLTGEGGNSYSLTSPDVELDSETQFTVTLNASDTLEVNGLLNKDGVTSGDNTTYNLAGGENWQGGAALSATIADLTGNGITVSNTQIPTVTSATYDFATGQLVVTGTNFVKKSGTTNDIDVTKLTLTGLGGGTRTLTTTSVEITNSTSFAVTLNSADKTAVNAILDNDGTQASDATPYNLNAAEDWLAGAAASSNIVDATGNGITVSNVPVPTITSATYDFTTGALTVTGTDFEAKSGAANDVDVSLFTITGEGGASYTLTTSTDVEITNATSFTVTLTGTDLLAVNGLLNKNGLTADGGTTYNLAVADNFIANVTAGNTADLTGNGITVSNYAQPTITSSAYDTATGMLVVTGTHFVSLTGGNNDIDVSLLTVFGNGGSSYSLTSSDVDITNATSFTVTLNATDRVNVNGLLNKDGLSADDSTTYNLAAADNWLPGAPSTLDISDLTLNGITVSNTTAPTITSATYDATTGVVVVTGTRFVALPGATNDIDLSLLTFTGDAGATYTLMANTDVEVSSESSFTFTLASDDKLHVDGLLNKNGVTSDVSGTTYNLSAADNWMPGAAASTDITDASNGVTVSNVTVPTITSASYDFTTGTLVVTGSQFRKSAGTNNDVDVSLLLLLGQGSNSYSLTSGDVEVSSATEFTVVLSDTDKINVNGLLNKNGVNAEDTTTYNLSAADNWMPSALQTTNISDATNSVTVSNTVAPAITSVSYDRSTGVVTITGTNFVKLFGSNNDVDLSLLTFTGENGATYTLTTAVDVEITSSTSFSFTLTGADLNAVNALMTANGVTADSGATYNLAAADNWMTGTAASTNIADLTSNGITVSNVPSPSITSATYDATNGILVVTGNDFVATSGATNDVNVTKLSITGEAGLSHTLTTANVEIDSSTQFTVTLNMADKLIVNGLLNATGLTSDDATAYNLSAADDFITAIGADDTSDVTNGITVSNISGPSITSATYDYANGLLTLTGVGFVNNIGATNDIDVSLVTITGENNQSYTLNVTADVDVTSDTSAQITLAGSDRTNVNGLLNNDGSQSDDSATLYNLAVADDWLFAGPSSVDISDATAGVTVSNMTLPSVTSVTYDALTGIFVLTGSQFANFPGVTNDIDVSQLSFIGEQGASFTLDSTLDIEISSITSATITLSDADKTHINGLFNKDGTQSDSSSTSYVMNGADNWAPAAAPSASTLFSNIPVTVSNVMAPAIISATYNGVTGEFIVTGTEFSRLPGTTNDIDLTKISITGNGARTYTILSGTADITSATSFSFTVSGTEKDSIDTLLNKNGAESIDNTTYNISFADDWSLSAAPSADIADTTNAVTVTNSAKPDVLLSANGSTIAESGIVVTFTATLSAPTTNDVVVNLGFTGTATQVADYAVSSSTITILAGQTSANTTITSVDDNAVEVTETVIVDITSIDNDFANESTPQQSTISIVDNDTAVVSLSVGSSNIAEAAGTATLTATLDQVSYETVVVNLSYSGSAVLNSDYSFSSNTISIPAGQISGTATVTAIQDSLVEGGETVIVDIDSITGVSAVENGSQQQTITITDDEMVSLTLSASSNTIAEAGGVSTLTVMLSEPTYENVVVSLGISGNATSGSDYTAPASSVTITAGQTTATTTITATQDSLVEGPESVIIDVTGVTGGAANESGTQQQTVIITDDETVGVTLSVNSSSISEASGTATLTATLSEATYEDVIVNIGFSGTAINGTDYTASSASITITAGQTSATTVVTPSQDSLVEGPETVIVDITGVTGGAASETGTQQQTVTITDDETVGVTLSVNNSSISEASGTATLTATLSEATYEDVIVNIGFGGTAINGTDYTTSATNITITAGQTSATAMITASQDSLIEGPETVIADITGVTGGAANETGTQQQTVTIDDDETVGVTLSVNSSSISEASGTATLTATLSEASYEDVIVNIGFSGTAINGTDYTASATNITITAGQTSATTMVTASQDSLVEGPETVIIDITGVTGGAASEIGSQQQTVTIDDDETVSVSLSTDRTEITEANGSTIVSATLSEATFEDVVVNLDFVGTATKGVDYSAPASSLTIAAGQTTATTTIIASQDSQIEGAETIVIDISAVNGGAATENGNQQRNVVINDDDTVSVSLDISRDDMAEAGGSSTLSATLSNATTEDVVVNLGFSGTAARGVDYVTPNTSLTIAAGQTSASMTLTASQDSLVEGPETVVVDITNITGGNATESGTQQKTITINDDETVAVSLSASSVEIAEEAGTSTLTLTLSEVTFEDVVVNLAVSGTAVSGTDYTLTNANVTIIAGQTSATTTITANQDTVLEGPETVIVDIADVTGGAANETDTQQQTITLIDDELVSVSLSASGDEIAEEAGTSSVTVTLSEATFEDVVVSLGISGTAINGADYAEINTNLAIKAGQTSATVTLVALQDNTEEGSETIVIDIDSVSGARAMTPQQVTISIIDDDNETAPDNAALDEDSSTLIDVLLNDVGPGSTLNPASVTITVAAMNGSTSVNTANGVITYTPQDNFNGVDSFAYQVTDLAGNTSKDTLVTLTVNPVNDAPFAANDMVSLNEDSSLLIDVLANDSDIDNSLDIDTDSVTIVTSPANGEVSITEGKVNYVPAMNFNGSDSFTYQISDKAGDTSNLAVVSINVIGLNDAPLTTADSAALDEDTTVVIDVLSNDTDIDGQIDIASVDIVAEPKNGQVSVDLDGRVTYLPSKDFFGTDSFTYTVKDDLGATSDEALVSLTVASVNDAPVSQDDTVIILEDAPHGINVLGNDNDVDGTIENVYVISQPENGIARVDQATKQIVYTPNSNFNGFDTFTYQTDDNEGIRSNIATVTLTIEPVNDEPLANDDSAETNEDQAQTVNILANDTDIDGQLDETSVQIVMMPVNGSVSVQSDGSVVYTPNANFNGNDSFVYSVSDDQGATDTASVTIRVTAVNDAPTAQGQSITTSEDTQLQIMLNGSDIDNNELTFEIVSSPSNGELVGTAPNLTYVPNDDFYGIDRFTFIVSDGELSSEPATIQITVGGENDAPIANDGTLELDEDTTKSVELTAVDLESDELTFTLISNPSNGVLTGDAPNLSYTPSQNFNGSDSFTFSVSDGELTSNTATVSINVMPVNDAPETFSSSVATSEDTAVAVTLSGADIDGDALGFSIVAAPTRGQLSGQAPNLVYTPNANSNGSDSFTFEAFDGELNSELATVSISVAPVNDAPIAINDAVSRTNWQSFTIDVLANDTDVDGDILSVIGATSTIGTVAIIANGLAYQPIDGFIGESVIEYQISDQSGATASALVTVNFNIEDDGLPTITPPADITTNATGLFTRVELGVASAVDASGNAIAVQLERASNYFKPGITSVRWRATDSEGRTAVATQRVSVAPQISFEKDQTVREGSAVSIDLFLNGLSPVYPLEIPYSVSGSADLDDHTLRDGSVIINSGQHARITFSTLIDDAIDDDETILIELDSSLNLGSKASHRIVVDEDNIAPTVSIVANQAGEQRIIVNQQDGTVVVSSSVMHPDTNTEFGFMWNNTENVLLDLDSDDSTFTFDPSEIALGIYHIDLVVTNLDEPALQSSDQITLKLETTPTELGEGDSDGDGIPDNIEGLGDADNDGIPNYLDSINECNVMIATRDSDSDFLVEGDPGVCIRLGDSALVGNSGGVRIVSTQIVDSDAVNSGGLFDFIATGLPIAGQAYNVVLPQSQPIPANAIYRKLSLTGTWQNFVETSSDQLQSAMGSMGYCPPPQDASWTPGLTEGDWCVQLTITDGGPNDADGKANNMIVDPGGVGVMSTGNSQPMLTNDEAQTRTNVAITIDVLSNDSDSDGDILVVSSASALLGMVTIVDNMLYYEPQPGHFGSDTLTYGVSDGQGGTSAAQVAVTIVPNQMPVAVDDSATTQTGVSVTIAVLSNDSDPENDALTISSATASNGSVEINNDNTLTYIPNAGFSGSDTINYQVQDEFGATAQAIVTVTVTTPPVVEPPKRKKSSSMQFGLLLLMMLAIARRHYRLACIRK